MYIILLILFFAVAPWLPSAAWGCACCGVDDTWAVETIQPDMYEWSVFKGLRLGAGRFRAYESVASDDQEEWSVSGVAWVGEVLKFTSAAGLFVFSPIGRVEHRTMDITFITQKSHQSVDSADIYHELVLTGRLSVPESASQVLGRREMAATLVIRGRGNMCFEGLTFQRWLVQGEKGSRFFTGSGEVSQSPQAHLPSQPTPDGTAKR